MKDDLLKNLPWLKNKARVYVYQNPINIKEINIRLTENMAAPDFKFIVAAGSLTPVKGFDILILAFKEVLKYQPDLKLIILGRGSQKSELIRLINELGLSDKVVLPGWVENVYFYFKIARACVVSSRVEGFPNVLLQEMACNNTVISTLCAGGIENIEGIYTCIPNSALHLAEAMITALKTCNRERRGVFDQFLNNNTIEKYVARINEAEKVRNEN